MRKVILNKCHGGFEVSEEGYKLYAKKIGKKLFMYKPDWKNSKTSYKKIEKNYGCLTYYFTRDLGDYVSKIDKKDWDENYLYLNKDHREDPILIEVVEELGDKANSGHSNLKIVEIPDDLEYVIDDYDGIEKLHERVQEW